MTTAMETRKAPLNHATREFIVERSIMALDLLLQDETIDHVTWGIADEARVKLVVALDSMKRWHRVSA